MILILEKPKRTMNKRYTLAMMAVAIAGSSMAQQVTKPIRLEKAGAEVNRPANTANVGGQRDVVFSEDFANGFDGNNGFGSWEATGPNAAMWRFTTTGPIGAFSAASQIINSPTVGNGFMILNGDSANTNFNVDPPVIVAAPVSWDAALESPVLDLSATPFVEIVFTHRFRWCCAAASPHALQISTDGGTTWPISYAINGVFNANDDNNSAQIRQNISNDIAGNAGSVKFRFQHNPNASHYHWQIDDVQIVELFPNNLTMNDGYVTQTGAGEEYGRMPYPQLQETILMGGTITNSGSEAQTNVVINVSVTNSAGTEVMSASRTIATLASGATDALEEAIAVPADLPDDVYTATFTVSADAEDNDGSDNTFLRVFEINQDIYGADGIGNHPPGYEILSSIGTNSFTDAADGLVVMNYYEIDESVDVYGIEFLSTANTQVGGYVTVSILDTADVFGNIVTNPIVESVAYDLTTDDVAAGRVRVLFDSPVTLSPDAYYAAVTLFSNQNAGRIRILDDATVPQPNAMTLIYIPGDQVFTNGNGTSIRMLLSNTVAVNENDALEGVTMFPNPTNGVVNVRTTNAGTHNVEVTNVLGAVVGQTTFAGSTTLDLTELAKGVYMVRVFNETGSMVERVTVE
ncbi:MAG: T9SS type A sorting domain-containing protein [Flavobacteriales bacterium]|nr:T9SS type A sorting domain-containing protein [Flavobacteriales bacterium]